jgi:protein SCO1/2
MPDLRRSRSLLAVVVGALVLAACGSGSDADTSGAVTTAPSEIVVDPDRQLAGVVRTPHPRVDLESLPSLTEPGTDVEFRAAPGGFQAVYFGFASCPDVCPTTLADWTVALRRLPAEVAERVETVMVTVDPDRDLDILPGYIESFVDGGIAAGTDDDDRLAAASAPFAVRYEVTTDADGQIDVAHSGFLYLVDDRGELVVSWPFGTTSIEMATDVAQLFDSRA